MKKIILLFTMVLFLNMGFMTGCTKENNEPDWELSPLFQLVYLDNEGVERTYTLRGIKNKIGITDAPLIIGMSQKVIWHFWDDEEKLIGKSFTVEGESFQTGEKITLFESGPLTLAPNLGSTTSLPSGLKLNFTGLWKLDIYLDNTYYETIFVEGKESN